MNLSSFEMHLALYHPSLDEGTATGHAFFFARSRARPRLRRQKTAGSCRRLSVFGIKI